MAMKERFALSMGFEREVHSLEELQKHFNIEYVLKYFHSGELLSWLENRYYDEIAAEINKINKNDPRLDQKICAALGIKYSAELYPKFVQRLDEKKAILKQKTNDSKILDNVKITALNQEDLADLLDLDEPTIYLCGEVFYIPIRVANKHYVGILGKPKVIINARLQAALRSNQITFENVELPWPEKTEKPKTSTKNNLSDNLNESEIAESKTFISRDGRCSATTTVSNKCGFHARPTSAFIQLACSYKSKIQIQAKGQTFDAKSELMIMSAGLVYGTELTIIADGPDSEEAVKALKDFIEHEIYSYSS